MFYGGKYMVLWKERKEDGQDAVMRSFDTTIESKSYIQGFVDAIIEFTDEFSAIIAYSLSLLFLLSK